MYPRSLAPIEGHSFFLFGPRGTGKSSWLRQRFSQAPYLDLLDAQIYTQLLAAPNRLETMIPPKYRGTVVIDEVQKVPALLDEVHRLIELRKWTFALSGSSARKLKAKGTNLLAGRALNLSMFPLTTEELGQDFDLKQSLKFGHLPHVYGHEFPKKYLSAYVGTYLREEIQHEGLVRNISNFARFLEYASFSQGNLLNVSAVAADASIKRKVAEDYFAILQDLLLSSELSVFSRRAKRSLIKKRKFYLFDVGVYRSIRPRGPLDSEEEIEGAALETLVLQEIKARNHYHDWGYEIFFWHTTDHKEVDFVLYGSKGLVAIEVERSARVSNSQIPGLKIFMQDYPKARAFCVYGGAKRIHEGGVDWIPIEDFLTNLNEFLSPSKI